MVSATIAGILMAVLRLVLLLITRLRVHGLEHFPHGESVLVVGNHFSWFEPPIMLALLPKRTHFFIATESQTHPVLRLFVQVFDLIPVWRGQVDRTALRKATHFLRDGRNVGIFPEGGVNPALMERVSRGEQILQAGGNLVRENAQLIAARSGAAYLAVQTGVRILPVAISGTENLLSNVRSWRRTSIIIRIGPPFGPLELGSPMRGTDRRQALNQLTREVMLRIAELLPPEQRGPYADVGGGAEVGQ